MRHSGTEQDKCHKRGLANPLICWPSLPRNVQESHGFALRAPNGAGKSPGKTASPGNITGETLRSSSRRSHSCQKPLMK